ncbi:MAG: signal transduction protein [Burkholderiales bacterium]|nr:signal transduction protein [Burkholderiales bacterium]
MARIRERARRAHGRRPSTRKKARGRVSRGQEYTIQQTSELLGIPIQKLRRWDDQGVLAALRTSGGHRRYSKDLIDRLAASLLSSGAEKSSRELATIKRSLAEKRRIIQLLVESENRYRDLVETSHDLIWTTDAQGRFTFLNNAAQDILGLPPKDLAGRCFFDFEVEASHVSNRRFLATLKRKGETKNYVTHLRTAHGEDRWIGINARVVLDENGTAFGIRGTARDITEQYLATQRIEHMALHDVLTDLPNRLSLQQSIENAMNEASIGALLFLDIAIDAAEKALDAISHYRFQASEQKIVSNLSISIGIALYPFHGSDLPTLLSNVDIAMYQAKDLGRNRYILSDQASDNLRSTHKRVHWAKRLRDALDEDRLTLFSQPVVRLSDQKPVHHEVLVRIRDDEGRYILPGHFIEIAESLGLVQEIDLCVVEKLLAFMRRHHQIGKRLRYFVNLSRVSISDQRWIKRFIRLLRDSRADPSQLVFEITETAAMSEIDVTLTFIRRLKDMGCRFALDDFGAGFSSFYYLKRFEVDYLKIDGSFIRDLAVDEGSRIFVRALNDVARGLSKQVIAEWVETPEVLKILTDMGAQYGQGYLFQRPQLLERAGEPLQARA